MSISLPEKKISSRIQASTKLIQKFNKRVNCIRDPTSLPTSFVIVGSDSSTTDKMYFQIKNSFFGTYKEMWNLQSDNTFLLSKIYFQLYKPLENNHFEELIALHCDLDSNPSTAGHKYKIHPHLHVTCAKYDNIAKSHFSLCLSNLRTVISKLDKLEELYCSFFEMVNYEIIN